VICRQGASARGRARTGARNLRAGRRTSKATARNSVLSPCGNEPKFCWHGVIVEPHGTLIAGAREVEQRVKRGRQPLVRERPCNTSSSVRRPIGSVGHASIAFNAPR
jgi:hypothetical protein